VRPEERDPLAPLVRESLRQSRTDCPDAELLAAYADRTLDGSAELELQRHLSSCSRCRETVLLITRAADAEAAGTEAARGTRRQPRSSLRPRFAYLKWLGGAAAAGLAVALWAVVAPREGTDLMRVNKAEDKRAPVVAESRKESPPPAPAAQIASQPESRRTVAKNKAGERERDDRAKLAEKPAAKRVPEAAAAPAPAPPAAPAAEEPRPEALLDRAQARTRQSVQSFRVGQAEGSLSADAPGGERWRVGADGSIQRSIDGGTVWNEEPLKAPGARALAAPAPDVCWIVGDAGLVLRYHAGVWQRLKPPADAAIVTVTAVDGLRATVTLADGRRLSTEDGGATWR
jgi:Putative zinc-finger